MNESSAYAGREQSYVKHLILRGYLQRFARIIGTWSPTITYVDGFSGPWKAESEDFSDTSFGIAINELRKARDDLAGTMKKHLQLRCFFVEAARQSFRTLEQFVSSISDVEIETRNAAFEEAIPELLPFLAKSPNTFPFVFIDPTGWSGYSMEEISPLLRRRPCEALINFMTGHIVRFITHNDPKNRESLRKLFGRDDVPEKILGLEGEDRIDALVDEYCQSLSHFCDFGYVCRAIVLSPTRDRQHFHLIYATRDIRGVDVFKGAEKAAMKEMEVARAGAEQSFKLKSRGERFLDFPDPPPESSYYLNLRERYCSRAKTRLRSRLVDEGRLAYDDALKLSLSEPLVWESDVREWLKEWNAACLGLGPRERTPKARSNHVIEWRK